MAENAENEALPDVIRTKQRYKSTRSTMTVGAHAPIRHDSILEHAFLKGRDPKFQQIVVDNIETQIFLPGIDIITEGSIGDCMYFLHRGTVEIVIANGAVVGTLEDGSLFGELALLGNGTRSCTVRARTVCDCRVLAKKIFDVVLQRFPRERQFFINLAHERQCNVQASPSPKHRSTQIGRRKGPFRPMKVQVPGNEGYVTEASPETSSVPAGPDGDTSRPGSSAQPRLPLLSPRRRSNEQAPPGADTDPSSPALSSHTPRLRNTRICALLSNPGVAVSSQPPSGPDSEPDTPEICLQRSLQRYQIEEAEVIGPSNQVDDIHLRQQLRPVSKPEPTNADFSQELMGPTKLDDDSNFIQQRTGSRPESTKGSDPCSPCSLAPLRQEMEAELMSCLERRQMVDDNQFRQRSPASKPDVTKADLVQDEDSSRRKGVQRLLCKPESTKIDPIGATQRTPGVDGSIGGVTDEERKRWHQKRPISKPEPSAAQLTVVRRAASKPEQRVGSPAAPREAGTRAQTASLAQKGLDIVGRDCDHRRRPKPMPCVAQRPALMPSLDQLLSLPSPRGRAPST